LVIYDRERSGQFLFFAMTSTASGTGVTSGALSISGRVAADDGNQAVLAGTIGEVGGGQYRANLFASDVSGNCLGFLFTASGCVPVSFTVITQNNVSGSLAPQSGLTYPASGAFATVPIASISGVQAVTTIASGTTFLASGQSVSINSGTFVTVPISSISGTNAVVPPANLSGVFASVPVATLSGVVANSGLFVTVPRATISGVIANSGLFVSVPIATISGVNAVVPPSTLSGVVANSGLFVSVPIATISGVNSVVPPANLSGVFANVPISTISGVSVVASQASGTTFLASGQSVSINSGTFVTVPIASISGVNAVVPPANLSGVFASVPAASISGVNASATILSGSTYVASGSVNVSFWNGTPVTGDGDWAELQTDVDNILTNTTDIELTVNSIQATVIQILNDTGTTGVVIASGQIANLASGTAVNLLSGNLVGIYSGSLSGQQMTARTVTDKSGYILANSGLDLIAIESGMNLRQAQAIIAAAAGGQLSGAGTATIVIDGANASGVNRVSATVDGSGNRTAVTLNLPG